MSTDIEQPVIPPIAAQPVSRRRALQVFGLASGIVAVAGATGLTWKVTEGGVFSTGTGSAYAPWNQAAPAGHPINLVHAAVLAANAHNTQPWIFTVADDRIELFADMSRTIGTMDSLRREMQLSFGCALENLVQAGPPNGIATRVTLLPDPSEATHIATVTLNPTPVAASPLFAAIADRRTNRNAYDTSRTVSRQQLDSLSALVDVPDTRLVWFTTDAQKQAFSDLTIRATKAIIADPQQAADDHYWYRSSWDEIQTHRDGITIDPSGQSPLIRAVSKLFATSEKQDNDGWLSGTRDSQLPTAAAFGAIVVRDPHDPVQRIGGGRIWQRMHLSATVAGLGMQPLCQIPERVDREASGGQAPEFTTAIAAMLPTGLHAIMTFRIGYPTTAGLLSPRRPVADVVRT